MKIFSIKRLLGLAAVYGEVQYAKKHGGARNAFNGLLDKAKDFAGNLKSEVGSAVSEHGSAVGSDSSPAYGSSGIGSRSSSVGSSGIGSSGLGAVVAASRLALPVACKTTVLAARSGGLGAAVAGSVPLPAAVLDFLLVAAVAAGAFTLAGAGPLAGVQVCAAGLIATTLTIRVTRRRLGGITGDVLGAAVELALAAGLLTAVLRLA